MICPNCRTKATRADAGIMAPIPYWYCRNCKDEVKEEKEEVVNKDSDYGNIILEEDYKYIDRGD